MSRSLPTSALKLALAATVVVLGAGGTAAGAAMASATAPVTPHVAAPPPPVDHHLCYTASGTGFKIPPRAVLKNQFSPKGFKVKIGKAVIHCNPVKKILPSGKVFGITNPNAHLACFKITAAKQPTPTVIVSNQFGKAELTTGQPNLLCLPSWKSLTGPPHKKAPQPPGLSHFTCYPVKVKAGGYQPPPVMLQDQFAPKPVPAQVSPRPVELCLPTEKIIGKHHFKIINPRTHLLCFPVSKTPIKPRVWDQNQFGTARLTIGHTTTLCLPSLKQVVHPPAH
jgi:hypothetical protein